MNWSLWHYNILFVYLVIFPDLNSIFSFISITTPAFLWLLCVCELFFIIILWIYLCSFYLQIVLLFNNIKVKYRCFSPILRGLILNLVLRIFQVNIIFDIITFKFTILVPVFYLPFLLCLSFLTFFFKLTDYSLIFYFFPLLDHYLLFFL